MTRIFQVILYQPLFNALILLTVWIPGHSLGFAIILLTVLIRFLLAPSAAHSMRQQHKLRRLQPELKAVQEKYKDDRETQAREVMALYKKYDIHPLGSCLPMLVQLPILFALYYVFRDGLSTSHFDMLYNFVPRPETVNTFFLGIDLAKPNRFPLPELAGLLQFLQAWLLLKDPRSHQPENDTQRLLNTQLLYLMPAITVLISFSLPAALPLYWIVTTVFAIVQQWWLFQHLTEPDSIKAPLLENAAQSVQSASERHGAVTLTVRKKGKS